MDNGRLISTEVFMLLCELLDEEELKTEAVRGTELNDSNIDAAAIRADLIQNARDQLASVNRKGKQSPARPAIPEKTESFLQNCISHMVCVAFELGVDEKVEILANVQSARDWLAKCHNQETVKPAIPVDVRDSIESALEIRDEMCDIPELKWVKDGIASALDWLAKCPNQEPTKPAIPEEVRETLDRVLACPRIWEPIYPRAAVEFASAREWVTACPTAKFNRKCRGCKKFIALHRFGRCLECHNKKYPTATDKAVCPKCWESDECTWTDIGKIRCWRCRHDFSVQVLVISPPREPKVAP